MCTTSASGDAARVSGCRAMYDLLQAYERTASSDKKKTPEAIRKELLVCKRNLAMMDVDKERHVPVNNRLLTSLLDMVKIGHSKPDPIKMELACAAAGLLMAFTSGGHTSNPFCAVIAKDRPANPDLQLLHKVLKPEKDIKELREFNQELRTKCLTIIFNVSGADMVQDSFSIKCCVRIAATEKSYSSLVRILTLKPVVVHDFALAASVLRNITTDEVDKEHIGGVRNKLWSVADGLKANLVALKEGLKFPEGQAPTAALMGHMCHESTKDPRAHLLRAMAMVNNKLVDPLVTILGTTSILQTKVDVVKALVEFCSLKDTTTNHVGTAVKDQVH